jgi:3',5'-cyclic AMP phosphodiesterase CpdA
MSQKLRFNSDGNFTIIQLTDLHYRNGGRDDRKTHRLMREMLNIQKPDLVVLTGDVIDGGYCRDPLKSWAEAVRPIVEHNLPWAAVFGNHDDEGSATRTDLMQAMQHIPGCLASAGPANISGVGNYILTIEGTDGPEVNLFFIDSHSYADMGKKEYAWIRQDQIDWYLRAAHDLPALMFFHIPVPEYDDVWNTGKCTGSKNELVCCPKFNSRFFDALKSTGDVMSVFVGHDHTNDFVGDLAGVQLCYGLAGGFSTYGKSGFPRGARFIQLTAGQRGLKTWVEVDAGL